jgi:hypothetical protein
MNISLKRSSNRSLLRSSSQVTAGGAKTKYDFLLLEDVICELQRRLDWNIMLCLPDIILNSRSLQTVLMQIIVILAATSYYCLLSQWKILKYCNTFSIESWRLHYLSPGRRFLVCMTMLNVSHAMLRAAFWTGRWQRSTRQCEFWGDYALQSTQLLWGEWSSNNSNTGAKTPKWSGESIVNYKENETETLTSKHVEGRQ